MVDHPFLLLAMTVFLQERNFLTPITSLPSHWFHFHRRYSPTQFGLLSPKVLIQVSYHSPTECVAGNGMRRREARREENYIAVSWFSSRRASRIASHGHL